MYKFFLIPPHRTAGEVQYRKFAHILFKLCVVYGMSYPPLKFSFFALVVLQVLALIHVVRFLVKHTSLCLVFPHVIVYKIFLIHVLFFHLFREQFDLLIHFSFFIVFFQHGDCFRGIFFPFDLFKKSFAISL